MCIWREKHTRVAAAANEVHRSSSSPFEVHSNQISNSMKVVTSSRQTPQYAIGTLLHEAESVLIQTRRPPVCSTPGVGIH